MFFNWLKHRRATRTERLIRRELMGHDVFMTTLALKNGGAQVILETNLDPSTLTPLCRHLEEVLVAKGGFRAATVLLTAHHAPPQEDSAPQAKKPPTALPNLAHGITHIIAVASGKGGVGKSTVATNLAVAMGRQGLKIGLLDADIYGPSVPLMMGLAGQKPTRHPDTGRLIPLTAHGVQCMSIGFLTDTDAPMIWRGPMVQSALIQLLRDVDWAGPEGLDILILDLPPGTGDTQLTLVQKLTLSGAIIVSTPQDVALMDARKGLEMFQKTNVPILGLIENMSVFCCPACGHETPIFGGGSAQAEARARGVPFLGALPLDLAVRVQGDAGVPIAALDTQNPAATIYDDIAHKVAAALTFPLDKKTAP